MIVRSTLLAVSWGIFSVAPLSSSNLPPQVLPVYGGSGGTAFTRSCGAGKVLTGLTFRTGLWMDAVGLLCRPVNSNGTLGSETTVGTLAGGGGGTSGSVSCSRGKVVTEMYIYRGSFVDGLSLHCGAWEPFARKFTAPYDILPQVGGSSGTAVGEACEQSTQPANGIGGRSASLVDAIGFICDEP